MDFHLPKKTQIQNNKDSYWNNKNPYQMYNENKINKDKTKTESYTWYLQIWFVS